MKAMTLRQYGGPEVFQQEDPSSNDRLASRITPDETQPSERALSLLPVSTPETHL